MAYQAGEFIQLRGRRWLIEEVRDNSTVGPILKLSCLEDDAQGEQLEIAVKSEITPELISDSWRRLGLNDFAAVR
ncbi:hypothetical protein [Caulobacter vibrioides]|jgi:hypothetical protein|uniref:Uncharacterized protein n=1 Tax=Caulobacter vibrioides OR37 TaxID=1292034 RepID=R0ELR9_CAUVI|nr:hypothetical protein [Caulobacter vibrioides]ENZ82042.1 hypothetical protein OR37_02086 [Caulobacter vibrioides OR37]